MEFQIEFNCPQCGAPACLEETDRLFLCGHCRVKSCLVAEDHFRYLIPCDPPANQKLVYFPYWHFKGMFFTCMKNHVESQYIDVSFQGIFSNSFPISLGLRSLTQKLKFVTAKANGRFLEPKMELSEILSNIRRRFLLEKTEPSFHTEFIGETISLVYSPFYLGEYVYDALLKTPAGELPPDNPGLENLQDAKEWNVGFLPALCPHCGWNLEGERESIVLHCGNCGNLWQTGGGKLTKMPFRNVTCDFQASAWLPFWRIKAETAGISLDTHQDVLDLARVPRIGNEKKSNRPFHFWIPAFKMWPEKFLPLAVKTTTVQPELASVRDESFSGELLPVNLPIGEAVQALASTLVSISKPIKYLTDRIDDIQIRPRKYLLMYVPFQTTHHEFFQPELKMSVHKNVFKLSERL